MILAEAPYQVHLPQFEGPFDLLLFFIERDELDVYDIPISKITDDFLNYIHTLERLKIEVAAEFIAMAARLMKIKSIMLLPRTPTNEKGEAIDPRIELVDRILEFKMFKLAQEDLQKLKLAQLLKFSRGKSEVNLIRNQKSNGIEELQPMNVYQLFKAFKAVLERHETKNAAPKHVIQAYPYSIETVKLQLIDRISAARKVNFEEIVLSKPEKIYLVFCFLCILELIQLHKVQVVIGEGFNNFWIIALED